jgi:DNA invertase Pin-like site-specific DNA recombinase
VTIAVSYSRFSDPHQAKGDSEARQARDFAAFCDRHKLTPSPKVFVDRGRSGYHDEHRKKGRLGVLIAAAKKGDFEPGTVIVVEAWDRLGRLRPDRQVNLLQELLETGVGIGVCRLGDIFTEEDFGTGKWSMLSMFIQLAYQESKQKAERVRSARGRRRAEVREGKALFGPQRPAWVDLRDERFVLIPDRAAVVRRIFEMSAAGYGSTAIVKRFHKEEVPAFGPSGVWSRQYVNLILKDRRAVGDFQMYSLDAKTGRDVAEGDPVAGYFPAAVTESEWSAARAGAESRRVRRGRVGEHINLFSHLLYDAEGGGSYVCVTKTDKRKTKGGRRRVLQNTESTNGRTGCRSFPYPIFERAILSGLSEVDPAAVLGKAKGPDEVAVLTGQRDQLRKDVAAIEAELDAHGESQALYRRLRSKEAALAEVAEKLAEAKQKKAHPLTAAWGEAKNLLDLLDSAPDPTDARLRLRSALRQVIDRITMKVTTLGRNRVAEVEVRFHREEEGYAVREYAILNRRTLPAGRGHGVRPGGWAVAWVDRFFSPTDRQHYDEERDVTTVLMISFVADRLPTPAQMAAYPDDRLNPLP